MKNVIKNYNRLAIDFNKSVEESNKTKHPSDEIISEYSRNALPKAEMDELRNHLEYCWHCGEVLADAEMFQQISDDVDAGILSIDVKMPSFEELKERAFGKSATEKVASAKVGLVSPLQKIPGKLREIFEYFASQSNFQFAMSNKPLELSIDWNNKTILLTCWNVADGIDIFAKESALSGKFLVVRDKEQNIKFKSEFFENDSINDMKVSTFISKDKKIFINETSEYFWKIEE